MRKFLSANDAWVASPSLIHHPFYLVCMRVGGSVALEWKSTLEKRIDKLASFRRSYLSLVKGKSEVSITETSMGDL